MIEIDNSKIIRYLKTIKEDELKIFRSFINRNCASEGKVLLLILSLIEQFPEFKKLNAADLNKTLFGP